jgi:hypothetical protein
MVLKLRFCSDRSSQLLIGSSNAPRGRDATTAMSSRHEGSSIRTHEPHQPEATVGQTRRSHPRGLTGPPRMLTQQRSTQSHPRDRPALATTIPNTEEASSLAHGPKITMTSPWTSARGLIALQATTTRSTMAFDTSVSYISFDPSHSA